MRRATSSAYYFDPDGERNGFHYDRAQESWRLFGPRVVVFGLNNLGEMVGADWNTGEGLYWSAPDATPVPLAPLDGHWIADGFSISRRPGRSRRRPAH
jgi:hypothetical protein